MLEHRQGESPVPSRRFGRPWELVFFSGIALAGLFLVATGAAKWREIAFIKESRWSKSPLPYHADLSRSLGASSDARWLVVVGAGTELSAICGALADGSIGSLVGSGTLRTVRVADGTGAGAASCSSIGKGNFPNISVVDVPRNARDTGMVLLRDEFVLVDSARRVVYGARDVKRLARIGAIVGLFQDTSAVAGPGND